MESSLIGKFTIAQELLRLFRGFVINLSLLPIVLCISMIVGFAVALIRYYRVKGISHALFIVVEIIRGAPFLLLVYAVYFILPSIGYDLAAYPTGMLVLSISGSALMSEVFLSGLKSIDRGQHYAADALGMNFVQKTVLIILPQMIRLCLPSIVGQMILTIKDTSIVSLVGLGEVVRTAREVSLQTHNAFRSYAFVALFFFAVCFPLILLSKKLERRLSISRRS
ncbi:MAG: amino acid ABC transporter permease [Treponema sp.]|jgi:His/Glu/Gln/Arg/opine family amino acid ABC transporter permease subunit|nr:amino acid ABC transporter permease [Treponema sp.]